MTARDAGADGRPAGRLWVVATPLGNLGDITARAREAIAECDLVACEDTRVTGGLLRHLDISKPMLAYHEHNEKDAAVLIADKVAGGARIALITDAGTPGISDPGFRVTRDQRLPLRRVPGAEISRPPPLPRRPQTRGRDRRAPRILPPDRRLPR